MCFYTEWRTSQEARGLQQAEFHFPTKNDRRPVNGISPHCTCASKHCFFSPPLPLGYVMMTCGVLQLSTFVNFRDEIENENG